MVDPLTDHIESHTDNSNVHHHQHSTHTQMQEQPVASPPSIPQSGFALSNQDVINSAVFLILALIIVIVAIYLRSSLLQFYGFYEPDGFYYYSIITQAVSNHFQLPAISSWSGWPSHTPIAEAKGIYWITLLPYSILQYFGLSFYTVMRLMPIVFALLDMFGAYLLSRYLSKDKVFGLLVIAFVGFSMGNAARTSATIYRGDTFVTFFLIAALVLFIEIFRQSDEKKQLIFSVLAGIALALSNFVWDGASFADATFLFAAVLIMTVAFIFRKDKLMNDSKYLLLSLLAWYVLVQLSSGTGFIAQPQLAGWYFIPIFLFSVAVWGVLYYLTSNVSNIPFLQSAITRLAFVIIFSIAVLLAFAFAEQTIIYNIFVGNGFVSAPGSFGTTIQELQPPTPEFLYTSFGINLFTTPQTLLMYMSVSEGLQNLIWESSFGILGIILLLILSIPYLFMQIYDSGGFLSGNARIRMDINICTIAIVAYLVLTAYLQMHVIRFNSLVSIPIAILSAYTIYWLLVFGKNVIKFRPVIILASIAILAVIALLGIYPSTPGSPTFLLILFLDAVAILAAIYLLYRSFTSEISPQFYSLSIYFISAIILLSFFTVLLASDNIYSHTLSQADNINSYFINALNWTRSNTTTNSVFLTLWPDGSPIEGVAHRISVTDSVASQNGTKADPFAAWLLNSTPDAQFLTSPLSGRPDYLLVRFPWLIETQGIYTEAFISENASLFGYIPLTQFSEGQLNATTKALRFSNGQGYPFIVVSIHNLNALNSSSNQQISTYIQLNANQTSPFQYLTLYNQDNNNYTTIKQGNETNTNGEMLLITYSNIPKPNLFINVSGAYIFAPGLANSNMLKFLYLCNSYSCAWNNNFAKMQLAYSNPDTKIFKITYLNST